jgi:hypothetical protein
MFRRLAAIVVLLLALNVVLGAEGAAARRAAEGARYRALHFDVSAVLERNRSLRVEETVTFDLHDGTFTSVWRDIPARRTDGIDGITASMDGVALPSGRDAGQVEIRTGSHVRITWHFQPTSGPHVFTLAYRLKGVATVAPDGPDGLAWIALPDEHAYAIDRASVTLQLPSGAAVIGQPRISPSGAEASLDSTGRLTLTAHDVRRNRALRVDLQLARGTLAGVPPEWQARERERSRRGPWLLLVAGAVLMAGLAWLAVFMSAWPRRRRERGATTVATPPDPHRPAAIAARLGGRTSRPTLVMTTLVELASRGVLRVEERPRPARLLGRGFAVRLDREPSGLAAHEAALLALAFGPRAARGSEISWQRLANVVAMRGRPFDAAIRGSLQSAGLIDRDRQAARRLLWRATLVALILTIVSVGAAIALASLFGAWVIAVPAALLVVTILFAATAAHFTTWTAAGAVEAERWRAFFAHLARKVKTSSSPSIPVEWLPWAILAGVGETFAKRSGTGHLPPSWFRAASAADGSGAFEAFIATHAAFGGDGGAGAAGGGGGAAGGGGSGAG